MRKASRIKINNVHKINKINKRGQLGKIVTAFPVMLLIFLIIGIYLFLSFGIAGFKSAGIPSASGINTPEDYLLLQEIEFGKKELLIDLMIRFDKEDKNSEDLDEVLRGLVLGKDNYCLFLDMGELGSMKGLYYFDFKGKDVDILGTEVLSEILERYDNKLINLEVVSAKGKRVNIGSYYGKCLEEQNE